MVTPVIVKEVMDADTVTTIINNLNTLYSGAMGQVITYTAIVIGMVGILIPALTALYQWRSLNSEKKNLEKDIQDSIEKAKLSIRNDLIREMKEQISIEEKALTSRMNEKFNRLNEQIEFATASIFFLQGVAHIESKRYTQAIDDFSIACNRFIKGEAEVNVQASLTNIIDQCLPKITNKQYEDEDIEEKVNSLIKILEPGNINVNGRYIHAIASLKTESKKAKARVPVQTSQ